MNELQINNKLVATIPSYEIAKMMDRRHSDVLRMLEGSEKPKVIGIIPVIEENVELHLSDYFIKSTYKTSQNKKVTCYECTRMGCDILANKMTGEKGILFTAKYVKRFREMTEYIDNQIQQLSPEDQAVLNIINANDKLDKALAIKDYKDIIEKPLLQEIDKIKPLAQKFEAFLKDDGLIDINTFAKTLGIKNLGRNNMYKYLRDNHYIDKNNYAMQRYINQKLFILKPRGYKENYYGERMLIFKTFITKKGLAYLLGKLVEDGYITFTDDNKNN